MSESTPPPAEPSQPAPEPSQQASASLPQPNLPVPIQPGERVLLHRRRHWIYLWPNAALNLVLGIVAIALLVWFFDLVGLEGSIATIVIAIVAAVVLFRLVFAWYRYHHDYWVVTNQRVIDVKRNHPLNLSVVTADLVNVQDMTIRRNGLLRTMLDYGDVVCQTAGSGDFMIGGVADPRAVQALVDRERDRERLRVRGAL
jgi:membrane protein YdbS with pleckstrin-like domain